MHTQICGNLGKLCILIKFESTGFHTSYSFPKRLIQQISRQTGTWKLHMGIGACWIGHTPWTPSCSWKVEKAGLQWVTVQTAADAHWYPLTSYTQSWFHYAYWTQYLPEYASYQGEGWFFFTLWTCINFSCFSKHLVHFTREANWSLHIICIVPKSSLGWELYTTGIP